MNPAQVAKARTNRLVREMNAEAVTYSTSTPEREHLTVIEWESDFGRFWTRPMLDSLVDDEIRTKPEGYSVSDIDHAAKCWCWK